MRPLPKGAKVTLVTTTPDPKEGTMSECEHRRQVCLADTNEWVCEDCMALMDAENPNEVVA